MTTVEQILLKLGIDQSEVDSGMRKFESKVKHTLHGIMDSVKDVFKEWAAPLSVAGLAIQIERTAEAVKRLKAEAEAKGVSTDFLQDVENVGKAAGVSGEAIESMLNKFIKGLPAGADVEKSFFEMADKLAAIPDPAERARVAMDSFGKTGMEMVKVAGGGSAALKQLAAEFAKFSETDIEAIESANKELEKAGHNIQIFFGHAAGAFSNIFSVLGRMSHTGESFDAANIGLAKEEASEDEEKRKARAKYEQAKAISDAAEAMAKYQNHLEDLALKSGTFEEKLSILTGRWEKETDAVYAAADAVEKYKHMTNAADLDAQIADLKEQERKKQEEADKKSNDATERRLMLENEIANTKAKSAQQEQRQRMAPYMPSLGQLAGSNGPYGNIAREIEARTQLATQAMIYGRQDIAKQQIDLIEGRKGVPYTVAEMARLQAKMGGRLGPINPLHDIPGLKDILRGAGVMTPDERFQKMDEHLQDVVKKLSGEGEIKVSNGE